MEIGARIIYKRGAVHRVREKSDFSPRAARRKTFPIGEQFRFMARFPFFAVSIRRSSHSFPHIMLDIVFAALPQITDYNRCSLLAYILITNLALVNYFSNKALA